ncbi:MAG: hypothetical protein ACRC7O_14735, partial [Fimbriiglobus sp.]
MPGLRDGVEELFRHDREGWACYRSANDPPPNGVHRNGAPVPRPPDFRALAERYAADLTPELQADLAGRLGLPVAALDALPLVGFLGTVEAGTVEGDDELPAGPCYTFPEIDARGRVTGLNRRFADGRKKLIYGHHRGLTVPAGWAGRPGPVFLVEGASAVLALAACGVLTAAARQRALPWVRLRTGDAAGDAGV